LDSWSLTGCGCSSSCFGGGAAPPPAILLPFSLSSPKKPNTITSPAHSTLEREAERSGKRPGGGQGDRPPSDSLRARGDQRAKAHPRTKQRTKAMRLRRGGFLLLARSKESYGRGRKRAACPRCFSRYAAGFFPLLLSLSGNGIGVRLSVVVATPTPLHAGNRENAVRASRGDP
jgi:hypothetical protein